MRHTPRLLEKQIKPNPTWYIFITLQKIRKNLDIFNMFRNKYAVKLHKSLTIYFFSYYYTLNAFNILGKIIFNQEFYVTPNYKSNE